MRNRKICVTIFVALLFIASFICSGCTDYISVNKEAKVLSINTDILRGKMIGSLLSSADGCLANDVIVVGIQVNFGSKMFLFDAELTHSEITYYADRTTLPMNWTLDNFTCMLRGYLNDREIVKRYLDREPMDQLYKELKFDAGDYKHERP